MASNDDIIIHVSAYTVPIIAFTPTQIAGPDSFAGCTEFSNEGITIASSIICLMSTKCCNGPVGCSASCYQNIFISIQYDIIPYIRATSSIISSPYSLPFISEFRYKHIFIATTKTVLVYPGCCHGAC